MTPPKSVAHPANLIERPLLDAKQLVSIRRKGRRQTFLAHRRLRMGWRSSARRGPDRPLGHRGPRRGGKPAGGRTGNEDRARVRAPNDLPQAGQAHGGAKAAGAARSDQAMDDRGRRGSDATQKHRLHERGLGQGDGVEAG